MVGNSRVTFNINIGSKVITQQVKKKQSIRRLNNCVQNTSTKSRLLSSFK